MECSKRLGEAMPHMGMARLLESANVGRMLWRDINVQVREGYRRTQLPASCNPLIRSEKLVARNSTSSFAAISTHPWQTVAWSQSQCPAPSPTSLAQGITWTLQQIGQQRQQQGHQVHHHLAPGLSGSSQAHNHGILWGIDKGEHHEASCI